jgi:hypothetical protein
MRLSQVVGAAVIGMDEHKIGSIDEVLVDRDGRVQAVVIGTGGLLGLGEKRVAVPFASLLWNTGDASRVDSPSASLAPAQAPPPEASLPAERLPGAEVSTEALRASNTEAAGAVNPATGPAVTGSTGRGAATVIVAPADGVVRAMARFAKGDLEQAPAFRYQGDAQDGGAPR